MNISRIISLLASLLTATQALLILLQGDGLCFSESCRIVDSLTSVPPLFFNIAGFLYFQAIFWGLFLDRKYPERAMKIVRFLALAGMASEGVLISFQLFVTGVFCSYCLVIFALIFMLNISLGIKQITSAAAVFAVVLLAFSSLQLKSAESSEGVSLDRGTFAIRPGASSGPQLYLFFSSTCRHCEKVIEMMKGLQACSIRFQPIDEIRSMEFPGLEMAPSYSATANSNFLKTLAIEEIPVLVAKDQGGIRILNGEQPIRTYLEQNCASKNSLPADAPSESSAGSSLLPQSVQDDACSVSQDCDPLPTVSPVGN